MQRKRKSSSKSKTVASADESSPKTPEDESLHTKYFHSKKFILSQLRALESSHVNGTELTSAKATTERGSPTHDVCHRHCRRSLLSHGNQRMDLRGFLNLLGLVVVAQNLRLILENFLKYGLLVQFIPRGGLREVLRNWPISQGFLLMHLTIFSSFILERHSNLNRGMVHKFAVVTNILSTLLMPYLVVRWNEPDPIAACFLLCFSVTWTCKLWSFHHVCSDVVRFRLHPNTEFICGTVEETREANKFPSSLFLSQFYLYIWMPTTCYQFIYPRTPHIKWLSVLRHAVEMTVGIILAKFLAEQYMMPIAFNTFTLVDLKRTSLTKIFFHLSERILKLSIPNLIVWILIFVVFFHHFLNLLAELTRFGDRQFYLDWWNAGSFGDYWRKWNLPIHNFLNRHVHKPLLRLGFPKLLSANIVFLVSAVAHEYLVVASIQVGWTGLIFCAFVFQIPAILLTDLNWFKKHETIGNVLFWVSFCFTGQPLAVLFFYYLWAVKIGALQA